MRRYNSLLRFGTPQAKRFLTGTHRAANPDDTLARVRPLMAPLGITRVANVTGLDFIGLPVVQVIRPNARSLAVSQGKGLTLGAATASGVMESIELYHAEHVNKLLRFESYEEIRQIEHVVDISAIPSMLGSRFHGRLRLLWVGGHDLVSDRLSWVPYETVSLDTTLPAPSGSGCFASTSNGLASGNHFIEAISHGICEVVERDATTLWQMMSEVAQDATRIDIRSVSDPDCMTALRWCLEAGLEVVVWDITQDIKLPSFQCLIMERTRSPERLLYTAIGMGCHPSRSVAFSRAVAEAAQSRLTLIAGSRDDVFRNEYELDGSRLDYLHGLLDVVRTRAGSRVFEDAPSHDGLNLVDDVTTELDCLRTAGLEQVIVVDLSKQDINLPVVKVVIPGLEGASKGTGYVPGRRALALMGQSG